MFIIDPYRFGTGAAAGLNAATAYRTTSHGSSGAIPWTTESFDTNAWHDTSSNTERFTVPSGTSIARVGGSFAPSGGNNSVASFLGGAAYRGMLSMKVPNLSGNQAYGMAAPTAVSSGNYFTIDSADNTAAADSIRNFAGSEALSSSLKYALVYKSGTQSLSANTFTALTFDSEVADTDSWHDNVTNNSRLTVPSGVSAVRIIANYRDNAVSGHRGLFLQKNGAAAVGCPKQILNDPGAVEVTLNAASAVLAVSPGDYFVANVYSNTGKTISAAEQTWFSIEEVTSTSRCLVSKSGTQSLTINTPTLITFDTEAYDTDAIHDAGDNTKLIVPSGKTYARISWGYSLTNGGTDRCEILKNGSTVVGLFDAIQFSNFFGNGASGVSPWLSVSPGDYFQMRVTRSSGSGTITVDETYFGIEFA